MVALSRYANGNGLAWVLDSNFTEEISFGEEVKNQEDLGYCFAFAATSLVENYVCRTEKHCESLSAMDAISQ